MTETRIVYQTAFAGLASDQVAGDVVDRCRVMLRDHPETRGNYQLAHLLYLKLYHQLEEMRRRPWAEFQRWYLSREVPDYRTIANRCQELMRADASLKPPREVEAKRQRQRKQGRVR